MEPEIAKPVDTFKESFTHHSSIIGLTEFQQKEIWRNFEHNYVDVLVSMHGWRTCYESEREKKLKAMNVIAELTKPDLTLPELIDHFNEVNPKL